MPPKNTVKLGKTAKNLDQFLTYKRPNLGPVFNFTANKYIYIYIYINIYMHAVVLFFGPSFKFGLSGVVVWYKLVFLNLFAKNTIQ